MKSGLLIHLLFLVFLVETEAQENPVRLSIESFYEDEGPIISKEYRPENFKGVMPGDPSTYLERGIAQLEAEFYKESLSDFNETILLAPTCATCYYYRGLAYLLMDSLSLAKQDFKTAIYQDVMMIQAYNNLSSIYFQEEKLDSAELTLERGIKFYPAYLPTYFNLGYYKLLEGKENKAIKLFDKCLELDSCHALSAMMKVSIFLTNGKLKEAEPLLDKMGKCNHDFTDFYLLNSIVKFERNKISESITEVNKAIEIEKKYNYYFLRGLFNIENEQYELAINDFTKSYELNSLESKDHGGSYKYREKQLDYQGILEEFSEKRDIFSKEERAFLQSGICYLISEEYDKAVDELRKLKKIDDKNDFYYLLFGLAKEKTYDYRLARSNYDKSLEINNKNAEAYKRRGLLRQRDGEFTEAMNDFNAMYAINPKSSEALKYRGIAKMLNKTYNDALTDFNEYEQKFDKDSDVYYNMGQCQMQMGLMEEAVESFKKILKLNPKDFEVAFQVAQNNYSLGKLNESLEMCDSILNNLDCHVMATNLKGVIQMDSKEYEAALSTFKSGIACSPYYADLHINKGIALIKMGRNEDAVKQMDFTLTFVPDSGLAYLIRAQAKHNIGDKSACKDIDKAISLGISLSEKQRNAVCK